MFRNMIRSFTAPSSLEVDAKEAMRARTDSTTQVVDVREVEEWKAGHIPGAIHIPLGQLQGAQRKLDSARPVITVCRSGARSLTAAKMLRDAGFENTRSMAGGMVAWVAAGQPVKR
jgi:rhodanese-related sulfurtransferase